MNSCEEAIRFLIKNILVESDVDRNHLSFIEYVDNYRTISLDLPRRIGKTTTLKKLHDEYSSIMFTNEKPTDRYAAGGVVEYYQLENKYYMGISGFANLKYQCIIFDNYKFASRNPDFVHKLNEFLIYLKTKNMLTKDFFILKIA
jgi:hypothetical protein